MARRWLLPGALASCVALWCLQWPWDAAWVLPSSAASTGASPVVDEPPKSGALGWLHNEVILASRTGYPLPLMIGFNLYGNIMLRKETPGDRRYPHWIFAWPVGLLVYTYPASAFSEMVFQMVSPRILGNNQAIMVFSFWFLVIQYCDPFYRFCKRPGVFSILTTWWLADATRVSLLTLERSVTCLPTLSRGLWQAFFWCSIVPVARCIELSSRGCLPPGKLDGMVPNTLNPWKHPLISMFFIMVAYLVHMAYYTDCGIFEGGLTMTECGAKNQETYARFVYFACALHLARSWHAIITEGKVVYGDVFLGKR